MSFYKFDQNNSGGSFDHQASIGIGYRVVVEAETADQANDKAEGIGLYFNGCDEGIDCDCCGDRWYPVSEDSWSKSEELPKLDKWSATWGIPSYVHYLDGRIEELAPYTGDDD